MVYEAEVILYGNIHLLGLWRDFPDQRKTCLLTGGITQVSSAENRIDVLRDVAVNLTALDLGPGLYENIPSLVSTLSPH